LSEENCDEVFAEWSEMLSDEFFKVHFGKVTNVVHKIFSGFHFYVIITCKKTFETVQLLTASKMVKSKYDLGVWYKSGNSQSAIRCEVVNKVLARLLLDKEVRNYFSMEENQKFLSRKDVDITQLDTYYSTESVLACESDWTKYRRTRLSSGLAVNFIDQVIPKIKKTTYHLKSLKKSCGDYAATYEKKKNIPHKTQVAMASSLLLKYFDDVEYDESVDLKEVRHVEEEIISFIDLFNLKIPEGASFKVRRLGKHRAEGIFFPLFCTLAIDVSHPRAFIHECWHMVDYYFLHNEKSFTGERLSDIDDFSNVKKIYIKLVKKAIDKLANDDPLYMRHYGNSKYNHEYYFDSTEIFARSAEMYFSTKLGSLSSLVDEQAGIYYPSDDKELMTEIQTYFENLLKGGKYEIETA
jgi:hypothetical protein